MSLSWAWPLLGESAEFERGAAALERAGTHEVGGAAVHAVMRETLASLEESRLTIRMGAALDMEATARRLAEMGYERVPMVEAPGQFAIRGGLMDIYPSTRPRPTRIELFGDEVESLREFDLESQRSTREVPELAVVAATEMTGDRRQTTEDGGDNRPPGRLVTFLDHFPADGLICLDEPNHIRSRWEEFLELQARRRAEVAAADRVVAEHLMPNAGQSRYLTLDALAHRL